MDSGSAAVNARNVDALAERLRWEQQDYWMHLEAEGPLEKYPAKQHARRVADQLRNLGKGEGLIYLPGTPARNIEDSDMPIKWRQRRYFYYMSGVNESDCHLTYDTHIDRLTLYIPRIDPRKALYNGRGSTRAEALQRYDIDDVYYIDQLARGIEYWKAYHPGFVFLLHSKQVPPVSRNSRFGEDADARGRFDSVWLQPAMNLARLIKDEHEIKLIKKANDISSLAHREILANIQKFKNEAQVEGLFLNFCISKLAREQAYDPIAASGPNAGTLHYSANNEDFKDRQLMCLDAGCEYELYASDITRTFPLSGAWPSEEAKNIYRLVERMQETCMKRVAPGVRYLDLHILAHQIAIDGLISLGILHNGTREEIFKAGTSKAFFPHGLGHHVGLEVHDVGQSELMSTVKGGQRSDKALSLYPENFHLPVWDPTQCMAPAHPQSGHLEEGMIVTIEPGIYFSRFLIEQFFLPSPVHAKYINRKTLEKYMPVGGVRIEDDILVTSKGFENLTTAPKGDEMMQIIRSQNAYPSSAPNFRDFMNRGPISPQNPMGANETMVRAPGISKDLPEPLHMPLSRAHTEPDLGNFDFDAFLPVEDRSEKPSLYDGFKKASAIDVQKRQKTSILKPSKLNSKAARIPVCGEDSIEFEHTYIGQSNEISFPKGPSSMNRPTCQSCSILVQTLSRLRKNLPKSAQASPVPKHAIFEPFDSIQKEPKPVRRASTMPVSGEATLRQSRSNSVIRHSPSHSTFSGDTVASEVPLRPHNHRSTPGQNVGIDRAKQPQSEIIRRHSIKTLESPEAAYLYQKSLNPQAHAPPFYTQPPKSSHPSDNQLIAETAPGPMSQYLNKYPCMYCSDRHMPCIKSFEGPCTTCISTGSECKFSKPRPRTRDPLDPRRAEIAQKLKDLQKIMNDLQLSQAGLDNVPSKQGKL